MGMKGNRLAKKPDQYVKGLRAHWKERRRILRSHTKECLPTRLGGPVNDCWRPSAPQAKADLHELHQEKMRLKGYGRVRRQRNRVAA
jgi:hypothetical protein